MGLWFQLFKYQEFGILYFVRPHIYVRVPTINLFFGSRETVSALIRGAPLKMFHRTCDTCHRCVE